MWKFSRLNLLACAILMILFISCSGKSTLGPSSFDIGDNDPNIYVAIGDSITEGVTVPAGIPYPARLSGLIGKSVFNEGLAGARSTHGTEIVSDVLTKYKPACLLILYGANDVIIGYPAATTISNLTTIIAAAKANKTIPVIANLTPQIGSHSIFQPMIDLLNPQIQQLAAAERALFVDLAAKFGFDSSLLQKDGLHPSDSGTQAIAKAFAEVLS